MLLPVRRMGSVFFLSYLASAGLVFGPEDLFLRVLAMTKYGNNLRKTQKPFSYSRVREIFKETIGPFVENVTVQQMVMWR